MNTSLVNDSTTNRFCRVVVFGSFYRGLYLCKELLSGPLAAHVRVVGIATDDPTQAFVSPGKRVWQFSNRASEKTMVSEFAAQHGVPVYQGRVKCQEFYDVFEQQWQPDLCIMGTFGQKINERLFNYPRLGFFNLHPCDRGAWPSRYAGSNPFQQLLLDGAKECVIALHKVDADFDTGELVAYSENVLIPPEASVIDLHKITSPIAALLVRQEITRVLGQALTTQA